MSGGGGGLQDCALTRVAHLLLRALLRRVRVSAALLFARPLHRASRGPLPRNRRACPTYALRVPRVNLRSVASRFAGEDKRAFSCLRSERTKTHHALGERRMASGRPIDHVVLAVQDLDRTAGSYQELGFTLTPRAAHEDRMGTSNRLAQFAAGNFIECSKSIAQTNCPGTTSRSRRASSASATTIDKPCATRKVFRCWPSQVTMSEPIFANSPQPVCRLLPLRLREIRQAARRNKSNPRVLTCLRAVPADPERCVLRLRELSEKPFLEARIQSHQNGAAGILAVYLSSPAPERDAAFVSKMFGAKISSVPGGCNVACGPSQELRILTPEATQSVASPNCRNHHSYIWLASPWPLTQGRG